mmetsp:Transcript_23936/g.46567  ORF Transcript_23936/g.46567 Transcript_23936/m.46567 type:complete len:478 (+) Transcript_23936:30-1463(+)
MTKSAMGAPQQQRRPQLLPVVLACGILISCWILLFPCRNFVPGPTNAALPTPRTTGVSSDENTASVSVAGLMAFLAKGETASAADISPLDHGMPGMLESGMLQGILEKCVFAGLLLATISSWWRGTVGSRQAAAQAAGEKPVPFWALAWSCLSIVFLLSNRWYESGHFPLSNMYESLMFLAWGVTAVTLYFANSESQNVGVNSSRAEATSDIAAVWASPTALAIVAFATLSLPKELQKASALVPALQSNWLVMHVSVVMLSYATLMFGSVLCMAVLALSQPKNSPITTLREAVFPALRGIADSLAPAPPQVATSPQLPVNMASTDMEAKSATSPQSGMERMQVAMTSGGGSVTVEFSSATTSSRVQLTEDDTLSLTLDDLAYRSLLLGFGFLTVGIISGAVWANEAWGNYWSWDPKETWALICWFVYAFYLHTRLQLGWDTRDSAKIGAFGFLVVWLCYIGVNLMGVGLHSYGFFLK